MDNEPINEYKNQRLQFNTTGKIFPGQKTVQEIHEDTLKLTNEIEEFLKNNEKTG